MKKNISYEDLDKHFMLPKTISPFFITKRVPRKFKKKYKHILQGNRYHFLTLGEKLWYILGIDNPNYVRFIIKQIVNQK